MSSTPIKSTPKASPDHDVIKSAISPTHELIQELKRGNMIVLVDDEDRENEGDLLIAAEHVTPEVINFMAKFGRGLICLTLTGQRCQQLGLKPMVHQNGSQHGTNFTASIEAAQGISTGISAADRARTVLTAVKHDAKAHDIVQPGHIFPLQAKEGGVLARAGHTEAGCDLAQLAGLMPAAVICEIMKDDGTMARLPDLIEFSATHQLKLGTIADLIEHRLTNETLIEPINTPQPSVYPDFSLQMFKDKAQQGIHAALVYSDPKHHNPTIDHLVRVHQPTSVLDLLVDKTHHSFDIVDSLNLIRQHKNGVVLLLNCEQAGKDLLSYLESLNAPAQTITNQKTLRYYGIGAQILRHIGIKKMRLLSAPATMPSLAGFGIELTGYIEH